MIYPPKRPSALLRLKSDISYENPFETAISPINHTPAPKRSQSTELSRKRLMTIHEVDNNNNNTMLSKKELLNKARAPILHEVPLLIKKENRVIGNQTFKAFMVSDLFNPTPAGEKKVKSAAHMRNLERGELPKRNAEQTANAFRRKKKTGKIFINELWSKKHYQEVVSSSFLNAQTEELNKLRLQTTEKKVEDINSFMYSRQRLKRKITDHLVMKYQTNQSISQDDLNIYPDLVPNSPTDKLSLPSISPSPSNFPPAHRMTPLQPKNSVHNLTGGKIKELEHFETDIGEHDTSAAAAIKLPSFHKRQSVSSSVTRNSKRVDSYTNSKNILPLDNSLLQSDGEKPSVIKAFDLEDYHPPELIKLKSLLKNSDQSRRTSTGVTPYMRQNSHDISSQSPIKSGSPDIRRRRMKSLKSLDVRNYTEDYSRADSSGFLPSSILTTEMKSPVYKVKASISKLIDECNDFERDKDALKKLRTMNVQVNEMGSLFREKDINRRKEQIKKSAFIHYYKDLKKNFLTSP